MKTKSLFEFFSIVTLLFITVHASAQWSVAKSLYGGKHPNQAAFSFTIDGKGYVGAGVEDTMLHEYDPGSNTWTDKGALPGEIRHSFAGSFVIGSNAYIVCGDSMGNFQKEVYVYEPGTNKWTKKHDFPGGNRTAGFSFSIGNYGYFGGGFDGSYINNDIWKYDPASDSWMKEPNNLPISGIIFPSYFVINNKGYVLLGGTPPSAVNEISLMWQFDPVTASWTSKADFPGAARENAFAFSNNQYGYAGGGVQNNDTNFYDMWRYDAMSDIWSASDAVPLFGPSASSAFVINNNAYVGLGLKIISGTVAGVDSFYKYTMAVPSSVSFIDKGSVKWSLYPNPATDKISIDGKTNNFTISIYDEAGHKVKQDQIPNRGQISIEDLMPGVYNLQMNAGGEISSQQFIKK